MGADLQDHVVAPVRYRSSGNVSLRRRLEGLGRLQVGLQWLLLESGLGATSFFEVGAFFSSRDGVAGFDMQHEFLPFLPDFQSGQATIAEGLHIGTEGR